jgi:hypothetical protein
MSPKKKTTKTDAKEKAAKRRAKIRKLALVVGLTRARRRRAAARRAA